MGALDHLARADAEVVVRAIAQGIAEGRRHGLEIAQAHPEWSHAERSDEHRSLTGD